MKECCPQGVDVFFDNTAGPIHDAVMKNLSIGARAVICGRVALAGQFGKPDIGERIRIVPNHACVVSNLFDKVALVGEGAAIEMVPVSARGRVD